MTLLYLCLGSIETGKGIIMTDVFDRLIGNDELKDGLYTALRQGRLAHAFLLFGPEGSGRHTLVREIASALNCERRSEKLPCHNCSACRRIAADQFPDLSYLCRAEDKATIGVDQVRAMREDMFLSPTESDAKIYVIEHAESLTVQAQNALLKVLEEPPGRVRVFLLTDSLSPILTTIKSRTQLLRMQRLTEEQLLCAAKDLCRKKGILFDEGTLHKAVRRCDGLPGKLLLLIDKKVAEKEEKRRQNVLDFLHAAMACNDAFALQQAVFSLGNKRQDFCDSMASVMCALRDLLVIKKDDTAPLLFFIDNQEPRMAARTYSVALVCRLIDCCRRAGTRAEENANMTLVHAQLCEDIKQKV